MRDATHLEQVERWARFVRDNPREIWKAELKDFLDAQIVMAVRFRRKLGESEGGREILERLRETRS
jgi:hypothetical protein